MPTGIAGYHARAAVDARMNASLIHRGKRIALEGVSQSNPKIKSRQVMMIAIDPANLITRQVRIIATAMIQIANLKLRLG